MRAALPILVSLGLVAGLTACAAPDAGQGTVPEVTVIDGCQVTGSGAISDAVSVTGEFGAEPEVSFTSPTAVQTTERTVVIEGSGELAVVGDTVHVDFAIYNGSSGALVADTGFSGTTEQFTLDAAQFLEGLVKTLQCSTVGSRVVGVIPPAEAWGEAGSAQLGVAPTDDIVFVADVVSIVPPPLDRADGADQPVVEGMPAIELDADGRPTVTLPDAAAPAELQLAVLKLGEGEVVGDGANVVLHYLGMGWDSGEIFDESWARGEPATFNANNLIPGFTQALVGQTVGSQVLVVIPPELAYGTDPAAHDLGGQTLVFVIDILGLG